MSAPGKILVGYYIAAVLISLATAEKNATGTQSTVGLKAFEACKKYSALVTHPPSNIKRDQQVELTEFPHIVALGYENKDNTSYDFICGGVLIAEQWVAAVAHCVRERRTPVIIRMGVISLDSNQDGATPVDRTISNILLHPQYSSKEKQNDIALVQFSGNIQFSDVVRPACIYTNTADVPASKELILAGWGNGYEHESKSNNFLKAYLNAVPLDSCKEKYTAMFPNKIQLNSGQMCAVQVQPINDDSACHGSYGGAPLMFYDDSSGVSTIVGISSYGAGRCRTSFPEVFTRMTHYLSWIENIVWPDDNEKLLLL